MGKKQWMLFGVFWGILVVFTGCHQSEKNRSQKYGGTLHLNLNEIPDIIFPGQVIKTSEQIIVHQVYNGLVTFHPKTLEIIPSIAKTWLIDSGRTIYTFYINNDAWFQDDICFKDGVGRKIVSSDFKYSIEQICRFHLTSSYAPSKQLYNLLGFEQFWKNQEKNQTSSIKGIKVVNDSTLVFSLISPDPMFIYFLAGTNALVFPKEAFEMYGFKSTVGSGPFCFTYPSIKGTTLCLTANRNYLLLNKQKEQRPFLDSIKITFVSSAPKELRLFENNLTDLVLGLPEEYLSSFLDSHINQFQSNPPYYVLKQTSDFHNQPLYHILRSNIRDLEINSQGYFDFSDVYLKDPEALSINAVE